MLDKNWWPCRDVEGQTAMVLKVSLYGLKSSGIALLLFRVHILLAEKLDDLIYGIEMLLNQMEETPY